MRPDRVVHAGRAPVDPVRSPARPWSRLLRRHSASLAAPDPRLWTLTLAIVAVDAVWMAASGMAAEALGAWALAPVASLAHRPGQIHFDDLQLQRSYGPQKAYRQSKRAMLMFGLELDRRLKAAGAPIRAIPVHPGAARTDVFRRGDRAGPVQRLAGHLIFAVIGQPAARGALPLHFAAAAQEAAGGAYSGPDGIWELHGHPARADIAAQARDSAAAARLWSLSGTLTGVDCTV